MTSSSNRRRASLAAAPAAATARCSWRCLGWQVGCILFSMSASSVLSLYMSGGGANGGALLPHNTTRVCLAACPSQLSSSAPSLGFLCTGVLRRVHAPISLTAVDYCSTRARFTSGLTGANLPAFLQQPRPGWSAVRWLLVDGVSGDVLQVRVGGRVLVCVWGVCMGGVQQSQDGRHTCLKPLGRCFLGREGVWSQARYTCWLLTGSARCCESVSGLSFEFLPLLLLLSS